MNGQMTMVPTPHGAVMDGGEILIGLCFLLAAAIGAAAVVRGRSRNLRRRVLQVLAVLCVAGAGLSAGILPAAALSGAGTEDDPYRAGSWSDLYDAVNASLNNIYVRLTADAVRGEGEGDNSSKDLIIKGSSTTVSIDLAGHRIDGADSTASGSVIEINNRGTLELRDSGSGGTVTGVLTDSPVINIYGGTFNMYGGTVAGDTASVNSSAVRIESENAVMRRATFNMYGGTISGSKADNGGGVYLDWGTFNMSGGTITGCSAGSGGAVYVGGRSTGGIRFNMSGGTITDSSADYGGAVYLNYGTFTMSGGTISGSSAKYGGGVYVNGGTFTLNDGTITGSKAAYDGGAVYVNSSGTFTMSGGTITGCTAYIGGGVFVRGTFNLSGGTINGCSASISGGVFVRGTFNLSGDPTVSGNTRNTSGGSRADNVYLPWDGSDSSLINITGRLTNTTPIGVTMGSDTGQITTGLSGKGSNANFSSDRDDYSIRLDGSGEAVIVMNGDYSVTLKANYGTVTDERVSVQDDREAELTKPSGWDNGTFLGWNTLADGTGTYYPNGATVKVTGDLTFYAQWGNVAQIGDDEYPTLQAAFAAAGRGSTVKLLTHVDSNAKVGEFSTLRSGFPVTVASGKVLTLDLNGYNIDRTQISSLTTNRSVIDVGGDLTLTGTGTITGGLDSGVNVAYKGTFTMESGTISGNKASRGGGVRVSDGGTFTMNGGKITGNTASVDGGGVYVNENGTFTMNAGTISGNTASYGGGVYIVNGSTFNMSGGKLSDNTASENGGGVYADNSFTMEGVTISHNTAGRGGGVYVNSGTFAMESGTISDCTASDNYDGGGGVYVNSGTFTMDGGTIKDCTASSNGGGVYVINNGGTFTMNAGTITGCNASYYGGGVYVDSGTFTMSGGTISGCTASSDGGGVYVLKRGSFTMDDGTIKDCTTSRNGGGVYVLLAGTFTMNDGTIKDCTASENGGGVYGNGSAFNISGGTISGCTASSNGGGVYVEGGWISISGSPVISGNKRGDKDNNVHLASSKNIFVTDTLSNSTPVGITMSSPGIFTNSTDTGLNDKAKFKSDDPSYAVGKNSGGQLFLGQAYTLTYDANGGTGSMTDPDSPYTSGSTVNILANTFTRTGYGFSGWNEISSPTGENPGTPHDPESSFDITADTTLFAQWTPFPAAAPVIGSVTGAELTYGYTSGSVSVSASAETGHTLSYQWYSNTVNSSSGGTVIDITEEPSAASAAYTIPTGKTPAESPLYYYCVVTAERTDNGQTAEAVSAPAVVTIGKAANPAVITGTASVKRGGNTVDLSANVSGAAGAVSYSVTAGTCTVDQGTGVLTSGPEAGSCTVRVSTSGDDNYNAGTGTIIVTVTDKDTGTLTVTQEGVTYGEPLPDPVWDKPAAGGTETVIYSGTKADGTSYGPSADKPTDAGSYAVSVTYETNDTVYTGGGSFTIARKEITVSVPDKTVTYSGGEQYGGSEPVFSGPADGHSASITYTAAHGMNASDTAYDNGIFGDDLKVMSGSTDVTSNYDLTSKTPGKLTINKADNPMTVVSTATVKRGGNTVDLSANVSGAAGAVSYSLTEGTCTIDTQTGVLTSGPEAGSCTVRVSASGDENYNAGTGTITVTVIDKDSGTLAVTQEGVTYGESLPDPVWDKPAAGGTETVLYSGTNGTVYGPTAEKPADAGSYTVSVTYETNDTVYSGSADFTIARKSITVSVADKTVTYNGGEQYGGSEPVFSGLADGNTASITYTAAHGMNASDTAYDNGAFGDDFKVMSGSTDVTANYELTSKTPGKLTIEKANNPAVITGTASVKKGGNTVDLSGNVSGAEGSVTYSVTSGTCTVDQSTGVLTSGDESGTCTVAVSVSGNENYNPASGTIEVTVTDKDTGTLTVSQEGVTYGESVPDPVWDKPASGGKETVIYSGTKADGTSYGPSADKPTDAGSYAVSVTYETSDTIYTGGGSFTISRKSITVSVPDKTVTYNGGEQYGGSEPVFSGPADGHTASITYTAAHGMNASDTAYDNGVFGDDLKVMSGGTDVTANYELTSKTPGKLTINKADNPMTVVSTATVKRGGNTVDLSANVSGAEGSVTYSVTSGTCSVDPKTGVLPSGDETGTCTVAVSVSGNENYNPASGTIEVTVTDKESGTLTVSQEGVTYGESLPDPVWDKPASGGTETVIYSGTKADGTSYGPSADKPADAGSYAVSVTYETNDTVYTGGGSFTIARKEITVSVPDKTVTYNGGEQYGGSEPVFSGPADGHTASITYTAAHGMNASDTAYDNGVFGDDLKVMSGETDVTANYDLTSKTPGKLTIAKSDALTVEAVSYEGVYDGTAHSGGGTPSVSGAALMYSSDNGASWTDKAPSVTNVGTITYLVKASDPNYEDAEATGTLKVTAAALTITAKDQDYIYNGGPQGENNAVYTSAAEITAKVSTESLKGIDVLTSVTLNGQETNAGEYAGKIVPSAAEIGSVTGNYEITYVSGKLTIGKAENPAVIRTATAVKKGGNTVDLSANVSGAEGSVTYSVTSGTCTIDSATGVLTSGDETGTCTVSISVSGNENYNPASGSITVTVTDKESGTLTVSQEGVTYGKPVPDPVWQKPSAEGEATILYSGTGADGTPYGPSPEKPVSAGSYFVSVTYETADTVYTGSADFTIARRSVTVRADDKTMVYGGKEPDLTASVEGLADGDDESVISYTIGREPGTEPGTYIITPAAETYQGNYVVTCETGTFTITDGEQRKSLSDDSIRLVLDPQEFAYDGTLKTVSYEVYDGETRLEEGRDYELDKEHSVISATDPGTYTVTVVGTSSAQEGNTEEKTVSPVKYYGSRSAVWSITGSVPPLFPVFCEDCLLPNTGFSSRIPTALPERPQGLVYGSTGLSIQLPRFDVETDLVILPKAENSWPVEWLGDDAGILEGSELPGDGYSVIAAHNTLNDTTFGPFALLSQLEPNDAVFVRTERADLLRYRVYANELLAPDDFGTLRSVAEQEPGSLTLVTCENESVDGGYLSRRVIFAKPVN